jgi:hypothetical protein
MFACNKPFWATFVFGAPAPRFISHDVGRMPMGRRDERAAVLL